MKHLKKKKGKNNQLSAPRLLAVLMISSKTCVLLTFSHFTFKAAKQHNLVPFLPFYFGKSFYLRGLLIFCCIMFWRVLKSRGEADKTPKTRWFAWMTCTAAEDNNKSYKYLSNSLHAQGRVELSKSIELP